MSYTGTESIQVGGMCSLLQALFPTPCHTSGPSPYILPAYHACKYICTHLLNMCRNIYDPRSDIIRSGIGAGTYSLLYVKWSSLIESQNKRWQVIKQSVAQQGNERLVISLYEKVHADQLGLKTLTCLGQREHLIFYLGHICTTFPSCCVKYRTPPSPEEEGPIHIWSLCSQRTVPGTERTG